MAHYQGPIWDEEDNGGYKLKFDLSERFLCDMQKMLREGSYNDVCIKLHDGEIKANKSVLAARCDYFDATFRWKDNNNHEVEEIVIKDCSKKIMTRIIEYIFTGILQAKDLNLLEFLELKDQVRKMFPGDELEGQIEDILKYEDNDEYSPYDEDNDEYSPYSILNILPTKAEAVKALSRVENGNLQSEVMAELAREIERSCSTIIITDDPKELEKAVAVSNLLSLGVIETVQHLKLQPEGSSLEFDLGSLPLPGHHLQTLVSCVTDSITIWNVTNYDVPTLLDTVHCKKLHLYSQKLDETEALVRAMTSRIEILRLDIKEMDDVRLAFDTFRKYKGDGKCREVHITIYGTKTNYGCDLTNLLDSISCNKLQVCTWAKTLNQEETEALVRAMTSRVEIVHLGDRNSNSGSLAVSLDFDTLTKYKGDGTCRKVHCNYLCIGYDGYHGDDSFEWGDLRIRKNKYIDATSAQTWAEKMNWDLEQFSDGYLLSRKKQVK